MERRRFLKISLPSGLALSGMGLTPSVLGALNDDRYARMKEENRDFEAGNPPGVIGINAQFPLPSNGRQLARRPDGSWFFTYSSHRHTRPDEGRGIGYDGSTEIRMRASRLASPGNPPGFGPERVLIHDAHGYKDMAPKSMGHVIGGDAGADVGTQPSMVIDSQGILHLVWTRPGEGEVWYAQCDVSGSEGSEAIGRTEAWRQGGGQTVGPERIGSDAAEVGDISLDGSGNPCVLYRHRNGVTLARYDRGWKQTPVVEGAGLKWPVMMYDRRNRFHVVWANAMGHLHYLRSDDGGAHWTGVDGKNRAPDFVGGFCEQPPSLAVAGDELFVAHFENYRVITYSYYDGHQWTPNIVLSGGSYDHTCPMFTVDRHEMVWMHTVTPHNWTRTTRWLGEGWSDLQEGRRIDRMATVCSAERVMGEGFAEFGVIMADKDHRLFFDTFAVPTPSAARNAHVMFLDLWDVARLSGIEQVVEPVEKDARNPLMKHGAPGSWDGAEANAQGTILMEDGRYRLWYTGADVEALLHGWMSACGYAESTDGVQWTKPNLGLHEYGGNKNNNICYPNGYQFAVMRMPEDLESNPQKRYRMAYDADGGSSLAYSPDGIHWTASEENPLWDNGRAGDADSHIAENGVYFYDPDDPDPERRYKCYPQTVDDEGERTIGLMISADGIHFQRYSHNPIMDARLGVEKQTHMIEICWRRHQIFLALYGCYLDDDRTDARLAVSRDGVHWVRVKNGVSVIPNGPSGSFDWGDIWPSNQPMIDGKDVWIYYSGTDLSLAGGDGYSSMGRGKLRLDGFAKMRLREGQVQGSLTTVPLQFRNSDKPRLVVNLEHKAGGKGSLLVEVLDAATGKTVPGYSTEECTALTDDSLNLPVRWHDNADLSGVEAEKIRLRFHFSGDSSSPLLCGFGFE